MVHANMVEKGNLFSAHRRDHADGGYLKLWIPEAPNASASPGLLDAKFE